MISILYIDQVITGSFQLKLVNLAILFVIRMWCQHLTNQMQANFWHWLVEIWCSHSGESGDCPWLTMMDLKDKASLLLYPLEDGVHSCQVESWLIWTPFARTEETLCDKASKLLSSKLNNERGGYIHVEATGLQQKQVIKGCVHLKWNSHRKEYHWYLFSHYH